MLSISLPELTREAAESARGAGKALAVLQSAGTDSRQAIIRLSRVFGCPSVVHVVGTPSDLDALLDLNSQTG